MPMLDNPPKVIVVKRKGKVVLVTIKRH